MNSSDQFKIFTFIYISLMKCPICNTDLYGPSTHNKIEYFACPWCGYSLERKVNPNRGNIDFYVKKFEEEYRKKLPKSYIDFIKSDFFRKTINLQIDIKWNIPEDLNYYLGDWAWTIWEIRGVDIETYESIFDTADMSFEWGLPPSLVLLDGDWHTWVALDYRKNQNNPPVIFIETDNYSEYILADNFAEFLSLLHPYIEIDSL